MKAIILPPTKTPVITPTPGAWHVDSVRGIITIVAERWDRETAQAFVVGWGWDPVKTSVEIAGLLNLLLLSGYCPATVAAIARAIGWRVD